MSRFARLGGFLKARRRILTEMAGVVAAGLLVGAMTGWVRYEAIDTHEALCNSCHHGTADPEALAEPPHSTDYNAECHACHVVPVKELLTYTASRAHMDIPNWVREMENPIFGGQTCLECHLARLRGFIECERCHRDGTKDVVSTERCDVCHSGHTVITPHEALDCRQCHVETFRGQEGRARERLLELRGVDLGPLSDSEEQP